MGSSSSDPLNGSSEPAKNPGFMRPSIARLSESFLPSFKPRHNDRVDSFTSSFSGVKTPKDIRDAHDALRANRNLREEPSPFPVYDRTQSNLSPGTLNALNIYINSVVEESIKKTNALKGSIEQGPRGSGMDRLA